MVFDDNRLVSELYGEFDQNIALVEQRLDVHITPRGNHLMLMGSSAALDSARRVLESLYDLLEEGTKVEIGDVDATIRMVQNDDSRLPASSTRKSDRIRMARIATRKSTIGARTPAQDAYIRAFEANGLVFGIGPAGTGKTYLAVAHAASRLERGEIERIVLSRPAVEAGERLGFLPGDMKDKVDPYLRPLYDALHDMMHPENIERGLVSGTIEVAPLAFMRGRTLSNAVIILDEAQNTTPMQMKMFLTRMGENSSMIVTGDPSQIDLPRGQSSGLVEALDLLTGLEGVNVSRFTHKDVVRHPLVARIVKAYDQQYGVRRNADAGALSGEVTKGRTS
ncbi:MAG TPA: phosphate starvation-inducible protein PhoH [Devosia sp.]|nr:phosphate starvation-inducible protein PhoH [Devosia sp.]